MCDNLSCQSYKSTASLSVCRTDAELLKMMRGYRPVSTSLSYHQSFSLNSYSVNIIHVFFLFFYWIIIRT